MLRENYSNIPNESKVLDDLEEVDEDGDMVGDKSAKDRLLYSIPGTFVFPCFNTSAMLVIKKQSFWSTQQGIVNSGLF